MVMGDQVPDVNNHIYHDDENGIEDFDFPDNDTLYNGEFQIGESSNPNLETCLIVDVNIFINEHTEDTNHAEDENQFVDEDTEVNIDFSEGQPHVTHDYVSPGGTLYWTPIVSDDFKPKVTSKFDSYGEAVAMYRNYALESGFDVSLGRVKKRKTGLLHIDIWYAIGKSNIITSCLEKVICTYLIQRENLIIHRKFSFKICQNKILVLRNLNCYISGRDAKFLVDKIIDRKKNVPSFTFEYDIVFVPFTGIDNHKKCVTFGVGLLSKEDGVSYEWLLRAFLKAFRKQPQLVISDQDVALKKAIDNVFPLAHHRLCMWHITKKLPNKMQPPIKNFESVFTL
uniref:MULE transposase domain-containing protein n=1 Tax=Lactuca sativa TaxID=4236 RepID=A0A9R1W4H2_LACSA|nr:hypothetical protein LSAT_V11C300106290 [Lactuca sativa]